MKTAKAILGVMAGSVALVGCTKPTPNVPAPPTLTKVGSATDACPNNVSLAETFNMKLKQDFSVIRTGPKHQPKNPNGPPGQLDTYAMLTDGQSAKITIDLQGNKMTFDGGPSTFQLKPTGTLIFCGLTVTPDAKSLTFYSYRQSGLATSSAYSLVIQVHDPSNENLYVTVKIDPVVDNDGINMPLEPPPKP